MQDHWLLSRFPLLPGNHPTREHGMCAMELVAWLAGEPHSDHPECACPVLSALVRTFNDMVPNAELRDRYVRPLTPRLVNSHVSSDAEREQRALLALDCAVRFFAPITLTGGGQHEIAAMLRARPEIRTRRDASDAATILATHSGVFAAHWTAARAGDGLPIRLWISGVAHAAKASGSWQGLHRLVESMIAMETPTLTQPS